MIYDHLEDLIQEQFASRDFVRKALPLLESGFREMALMALYDWQKTGVSSSKLYDTIATLNRPGWGAWNGLLDGLKNARTQILRTGTQEKRKLIESASELERILTAREKRVSPELIEKLSCCKKFTSYEFSQKTRLKKLMELPIFIRNIIAHQSPHEDAWWEWAEQSILLLIPELHRIKLLESTVKDYPAPWFLSIDGKPFAFNGLTDNNQAIFSYPGELYQHNSNRGREILEIFKDVLGESKLATEDFERTIKKLRSEDSSGILLGEFLLHYPIGEGGFATVYLATQLSTDRKVAIKILKDGMDEDIKERFRNEAKHLASFYDNENIVDVINYGNSSWRKPSKIDSQAVNLSWYQTFKNGAPTKDYIAMEWVDGVTLDELYGNQKKHHTYSQHQLVGFFIQAARAIVAIHANGLIHRDIKPDNIMLDSKQTIKVMDFGIARSDDENRTLRTLTGIQPGTPAYMSPEQLRAKDADAEVGQATDIYSLGATFYELFTCTRIYDHDNTSSLEVNIKKLKADPPPSPKLLNKRLSWEITTLLDGCLQCEISDRISSSEELKSDLIRILNHEIIRYKKPSLFRQSSLSYKRNKTIFHLSAAFLLILSGGIAIYIRDTKR